MKLKKDFFRRAAWLSMALIFVLTGVVFGVVAIFQSGNQDSSQTQNTGLKGTKLQNFQPIANVDKLRTKDVVKGKGKLAKVGSAVSLHYVGAIASTGTIFDSSLDSGQPVPLSLKTGPGGVIPGLFKGIEGMRVGGERTIIIPSALAYGKQSPSPDIPPNSDLVFDILLVGVK